MDDTVLIDTLQKSKKTSEEVKEALAIGEETEKNIDIARENYRPIAARWPFCFSRFRNGIQLVLCDPQP